MTDNTTQPSHTSELLPCPFCGGTNLEVSNLCVACANCFACGGGDKLDGVEDAWNTRAAPETAALCETLRAELCEIKLQLEASRSARKSETERANNAVKRAKIMHTSLEKIRDYAQKDVVKYIQGVDVIACDTIFEIEELTSQQYGNPAIANLQPGESGK